MPTLFPNSLDTFVNPTATDRGSGAGNPAVLHTTQHSNHNDAISAIENKVGVNFSSVTTSIDFGIRILETMLVIHPDGGYSETTYVSGVFPNQTVLYTNSSKNIKLIEKNTTYGPSNKKFVSTIEWKLYDGSVSNVLKKTILVSITRNGIKETSRTIVIT